MMFKVCANWSRGSTGSRSRRIGVLVAASLGSFGMLAAGCGSNDSASEPEVVEVSEVAETVSCAPLTVVTGFYPLQFIADKVGASPVSGNQTIVKVLAAPGVEPHDLELTPSQAAEVTDADVVVYLPGFMPALDEAVTELNPSAGLDAMSGLTLISGKPHDHDHGHSHDDDHGHSHDDDHGHEKGDGHKDGDEKSVIDPHVWLDPTNVSAIGQALAARLSTLDPACADIYAANADALTVEMADLDDETKAALDDCKIKTMVVSHEAFGYLANRYGFEQVGISGLVPDAEPSPRRLADVAKVSKKDGVTTIYYETLVSPVVAETLAKELRIEAAQLDPLESQPATGDFVSTMRSNLETLVKGQNCG